ncbi:hypothetical protein KSP40_PGU003482 [Platanthera guangdongensis]|uniref:Uncharacterized protein n=1 Tax=Platanthera guangdongensis TaxID=2320717 RepID=A0ABR2MCQ5_9ASPA
MGNVNDGGSGVQVGLHHGGIEENGNHQHGGSGETAKESPHDNCCALTIAKPMQGNYRVATATPTGQHHYGAAKASHSKVQPWSYPPRCGHGALTKVALLSSTPPTEFPEAVQTAKTARGEGGMVISQKQQFMRSSSTDVICPSCGYGGYNGETTGLPLAKAIKGAQNPHLREHCH